MKGHPTGNDVVRIGFDADRGIATLTIQMEGRANKINAAFGEGLADAVEAALGIDGVKGLVITSGHRDFCVGGDIDVLYAARDAAVVRDGCRKLNALLRRIETAGVPVVAALNGSALGGGYELAMACHHRIILDDARLKVGLPEATLGLIPGAGGTQRLPRLIGLQAGLECILEGKMVRAPKALKMGMVDALAADVDAMHEAAAAWIAANPKAKQPWDSKGFTYPGPQPESTEARGLFMVGAAMLRKKTAGTMRAPELAMSAVYEGANLEMNGALEVVTWYFTEVAVSDGAKDMIRLMWFHRTAAERMEGLSPITDHGFDTIGILGAGMMGAGLAYISAVNGAQVVLKDISQESLDKGMAHVAKQTKKRAKHKGAAEAERILGLITPTLENADLAGCDLIIEAVFEDDGLKARVTKEVEAVLSPGAVFASNTSAIPINHLAKASVRPNEFIGLHFFSPVEAMPLLEVICGDATSDETLGRCLGWAKQVNKLPIVVGDGYGFYTSRTFAAYLLESVQLVAEGHDPVLIEWAARQAGMAVAPLKVFDEVSLKLGSHGMSQAKKFNPHFEEFDGIKLLATMVNEHERYGKAHGAGFYDYEGRERRIWPGLKDLASGTPDTTGVDVIADRLMLAQVNQVAWCLEEGILKNHRDAEVGAVFGIGFSPSSGGPLSWMDRRGLRRVVQELQALERKHGRRFQPPPSLVDMAERGERFFPEA